MSEEVKDTQHQMYVQQIDWETFLKITERVTNVNKLYSYNMPNRADKYVDNIPQLIQTMDSYLTGDDNWRITTEENVSYRLNEGIELGDWKITGFELIICIPKINSFIAVPNAESTYKGSKSPTTILQLTNCISIMPMLLVMNDEKDEKEEGKFNISMSYEIMQFPKIRYENEKPTE